jgi:hypothetical protein
MPNVRWETYSPLTAGLGIRLIWIEGVSPGPPISWGLIPLPRVCVLTASCGAGDNEAFSEVPKPATQQEMLVGVVADVPTVGLPRAAEFKVPGPLTFDVTRGWGSALSGPGGVVLSWPIDGTIDVSGKFTATEWREITLKLTVTLGRVLLPNRPDPIPPPDDEFKGDL